jgi:type II secretory pathway component GspD/PulD (secretin)
MMSYLVAAVALTTLPGQPFSGLASALNVVKELRTEFAFTAVHLICVDATKAAELLTASLGEIGDVTIVADAKSNSVFIRANTEKMGQAKDTLQQLDAEARLRAGTRLHVLPLKHAKAAEAAKALKAYLGDVFYGDILGEERANMIIIYAASPNEIWRAKMILQRLDVKGR